jgi:hypothetical protein
MSCHIKNDPELSLPQSALKNMDHISQPRHTDMIRGISNMASRPIQDDELSSQDNFSLCSSTHQSHGTPNGLPSWALGDVDSYDSGVIPSTKPESPEVQMLSFNLSHQLMPSTVGPSDVMYHTGSDYSGFHDNDLDYSHGQEFNHYSSMVDLTAYDNDVSAQSGNQSCTDDALSVSHSSHTDDSHLAANDAWNSLVNDSRSYPGSALDQFSSNMFHPVPVSPPLTEASNDVSVTSSCSHSGYPSFMTHEDAMLKDVTATPVGSHGINLGDPLFPLTPPLAEQDPNK